MYLTKELGFKIIDTAIDVSYAWSPEEITILMNGIRKSFDYFIEAAKKNQGFRWDFVDKVVNFKNKRKKFYTCGAGIISSYVRTEGGIYACPGNLSPSAEIGTVEDGLKKKNRSIEAI